MNNVNISRVIEKIEAVRNGEKAYVFKNLAPATPTWDQFIAHLDDAIHNFQPSPSQEPLEQRIINGVIQRRLFYLMVDGPTQHYYPESQAVHDIFNEALNTEISPVSAFINFIGREKAGGAHTDNRETIYWQCIGEAVWHIYDSLEDRYPRAEYVLQPGDVIFVAEGVIHQVRADQPRAAIGFQYRPNDPSFNRPEQQNI
jgi:mannose-6-phosphate isomerase-like protein (cupin superfamily)